MSSTERNANPAGAEDGGIRILFHFPRHWPAASDPHWFGCPADVKRFVPHVCWWNGLLLVSPAMRALEERQSEIFAAFAHCILPSLNLLCAPNERRHPGRGCWFPLVPSNSGRKQAASAGV